MCDWYFVQWCNYSSLAVEPWGYKSNLKSIKLFDKKQYFVLSVLLSISFRTVAYWILEDMVATMMTMTYKTPFAPSDVFAAETDRDSIPECEWTWMAWRSVDTPTHTHTPIGRAYWKVYYFVFFIINIPSSFEQNKKNLKTEFLQDRCSPTLSKWMLLKST